MNKNIRNTITFSIVILSGIISADIFYLKKIKIKITKKMKEFI